MGLVVVRVHFVLIIVMNVTSKDNDDGTVDADEDDDGVDDVKQGNDEKDNRMKDVNFYLIQRCTYLIFVTGTTSIDFCRALCPEGVTLRGLDSLASASLVVVAVPRYFGQMAIINIWLIIM